MNQIYSEISKHFNLQAKVVIFSHINPDGDAIGSSLGLYHYLKSRVGDVQVVMPNRFPDFLKFLPGADRITVYDQQTQKASEIISEANILFFLDFNDIKRIEKVGEKAGLAKGLKIMIDHHPEPVSFADYTISDTSVSSTSELVFEFVSGIEKFTDVNMANCLLAGIITDTGLFNHNSERRRTFEIVALLLDMGANKASIIQKIYNEYPYHRMQLLGNALHNRLVVYPEYGAAYIFLTRDDLIKYKHQIGDTEGFVNIPLSIAGIKFSTIFIEKDDHVKCSFRSYGAFDVNQFARNHFNGGGHLNAAGGKSTESLYKTIETFVQLLDKYQNNILQKS